MKFVSSIKTDYVIMSFDLTQYMDDIYTEEWRADENIEKWQDYKFNGNVQLFSDPMSRCHLYFGYIVSEHNEYNDSTTKIILSDYKQEYVCEIYNKVINELKETKLISESIMNIIKDGIPFELICFTEYR